MAWATFNVNAGMIVAGILLLIGGAITLLTEDSQLHAVGIGVVLLSGVIYLGARIWMLYRSLRK